MDRFPVVGGIIIAILILYGILSVSANISGGALPILKAIRGTWRWVTGKRSKASDDAGRGETLHKHAAMLIEATSVRDIDASTGKTINKYSNRLHLPKWLETAIKDRLAGADHAKRPVTPRSNSRKQAHDILQPKQTPDTNQDPTSPPENFDNAEEAMPAESSPVEASEPSIVEKITDQLGRNPIDSNNYEGRHIQEDEGQAPNIARAIPILTPDPSPQQEVSSQPDLQLSDRSVNGVESATSSTSIEYESVPTQMTHLSEMVIAEQEQHHSLEVSDLAHSFVASSEKRGSGDQVGTNPMPSTSSETSSDEEGEEARVNTPDTSRIAAINRLAEGLSNSTHPTISNPVLSGPSPMHIPILNNTSASETDSTVHDEAENPLPQVYEQASGDTSQPHTAALADGQSTRERMGYDWNKTERLHAWMQHASDGEREILDIVNEYPPNLLGQTLAKLRSSSGIARSDVSYDYGWVASLERGTWPIDGNEPWAYVRYIQTYLRTIGWTIEQLREYMRNPGHVIQDDADRITF